MDPDSPAARGASRARRGPRTTPRLSVAVTDFRGRPQRAPGLAAWLQDVAPASARGEVVIALVSDRRIQSLNREFRRKDQPTDVLSFPADQVPAVTAALGDIVIATGVARRQARQARHSYASELKVLALHGLLHLIGYDHDAMDDRGRMARLERRLRAKGGLHEGLVERSTRVAPAATAAAGSARHPRRRAGTSGRRSASGTR